MVASAETAAGAAPETEEAMQPASAGQGDSGTVAAPLPVAGQQLAIEARAAVQADDVRAAVDGVTLAVTARGGRVAAADVDYAAAVTDETTGTERPDTSRATLVLSVPPDQLTAIATALDELGTVTSFDQLAEDVTEQLTDLDVRIANMRASVERVRALLDQAVDIDGIVRLEAELTARETELERLLAAQRQLDDRVAMSTLTVDITPTPEALAAADEDDPGIVDALGAGWDAFTTGLFSIVLVLAAVAPFAGLVVLLGALGLVARRLVLRRRPAPQPTAPTSLP